MADATSSRAGELHPFNRRDPLHNYTANQCTCIRFAEDFGQTDELPDHIGPYAMWISCWRWARELLWPYGTEFQWPARFLSAPTGDGRFALVSPDYHWPMPVAPWGGWLFLVIRQWAEQGDTNLKAQLDGLPDWQRAVGPAVTPRPPTIDAWQRD